MTFTSIAVENRREGHITNECAFIFQLSLVAQTVKNLPAMQETWDQSLGWEDPLEKEMATHSSVLAWRIPWTEEPGGLQSMGSPRVGCDWVTNTFQLYLQLGDSSSSLSHVPMAHLLTHLIPLVFSELLLYARLFQIAGAQICSARFSPTSALIYEDIWLFCWIFTLRTAQNLKREVCRVKSLKQHSVGSGWKGGGLWESRASCSTRDGLKGGVAGPLPSSTSSSTLTITEHEMRDSTGFCQTSSCILCFMSLKGVLGQHKWSGARAVWLPTLEAFIAMNVKAYSFFCCPSLWSGKQMKRKARHIPSLSVPPWCSKTFSHILRDLS